VSVSQQDAAPPTEEAERRCPACGAPLYGWAVVRASDPADATEYVLDRCEECGLGMMRDPAWEPAGWHPEPGGTVELRLPNRASWQAGLGGDRWAALDLPDRRLLPTPRSLDLLLPRLGLEPVAVRQPALGRNQRWMWQTLLNGFTFHANFAGRALRRQLTPRTARNLPSFIVDTIVSVLAALPLAVIAFPLELVATLARRGGELVVTVARAD